MKVSNKFKYSLISKILLFCLILTSCGHDKNTTIKNYSLIDINKLPELPLHSLSGGRGLEFDLEESYLTIPIEPIKKDQPIINPPHECINKSYPVWQYLTQVTYPKVICYPIDAPTDQVIKRNLTEHKSIDKEKNLPSKEEDTGVKFFKLSILNNEKIQNPLLCSVHYGPWSAIVNKYGRCCDEDLIRWELTVISFPEIKLVWNNTFEEIPSDLIPNLGVFPNDLYLLNESFDCCGDFRLINGSCVKKSDLGDNPNEI